MTIHVGVLGLAHGHVTSYLKAWREHPEWGVRAVAAWDHDPARLAKGSADHNLAAHADVDGLLGTGALDAVVIGAETSFHADLVERAAAAGLAIIVQKPLALTMPEADRIVRAVERAGVRFTMAWQMRVDPQNLQMRDLVRSGAIGRVYMVRRRHGLSLHLWANYWDLWHVKPEYNRDIWADDASHAIDWVHWMLGAPETVTAEVESLRDPRVPMDNGVAIFRYPGGPLAEVCCSFTCPAAENSVEIVGETGTIVQNYGDAPSANVARPRGGIGLKWYTTASGDWTVSDIPSPSGQGERIAGLSEPLAAFLRGEREPIATAEEGRTSLRMTLACYVSTREGRRVRLDDPAVAGV